jgi:leucyl aminopeptidase
LVFSFGLARNSRKIISFPYLRDNSCIVIFLFVFLQEVFLEYELFADVKRAKLSLENTPKPEADDADGCLILVPGSDKKTAKWDDALGFLSASLRSELAAYVARFEFKPKAGEVLAFDKSAKLRVVLAVLPENNQMFGLLELARKALEPLLEAKSVRVRVDLRAAGENAVSAAHAIVCASMALVFEAKNYGEPSQENKKLPALHFVLPKGAAVGVESLLATAESVSATNLVRYLSGLAGNDLTPSSYVRQATAFAKKAGLKTEFFSLDKLEKLKAGAFLAVARASEDRGAGILKISYRPSKPSKKVALVGKGITFDTGGIQLKKGEHMFGMNGDMGGSAVALALVLLAGRQKWPWEINAYLAIAENATGPKCYKPNDVVKAMSGKTIEVIDADAEGRMILSDALHLAGLQEPHLMMDFATLTGACVQAIGTNYSGAYTNRVEWMNAIIEAGRVSGERVWPFPNDADYGTCLKSDIADIKQCRLTGGSDHIEAGYFLSQFVPKQTGWVHVDLSAAESEEGLAHVPTKLTGFGVRFAAEFLRTALKA